MDDRDFDPRAQLEISLDRGDLREQALCYLGRDCKADSGADHAQSPEEKSIYCCRFGSIRDAVRPANCNTKGRLLRSIPISIKIPEPFAVRTPLVKILCCLCSILSAQEVFIGKQDLVINWKCLLCCNDLGQTPLKYCCSISCSMWELVG